MKEGDMLTATWVGIYVVITGYGAYALSQIIGQECVEFTRLSSLLHFN
jgi:hypothetical protein